MFIIKIFIKSLFLLLLQNLTLSSGNRMLGHHNRPHHSLISDKAALLAFKKTIISYPNSTLANWDEAVEVCNFTGVRCNKQHHRVSQLVLENTGLVGQLSPFISNLTGLRILTIVGNHFSGNIPPELSSLRRLRNLRLERNNLHGSIPSSFALLSELELLQIFHNNISGKLSPALFSNCSSLQNIDLSENFLTGIIPEDIGNCSRLWNLYLYNNNFTGQLPFSLANLGLSELDVENNLLSGVLPSEIVRNLPELLYLHLSYNPMESHDNNTNLVPFFNALGNCTHLLELELFGIGLGGKLPSSIGQLGVNLTALLLQENKIFGSIPLELGNLSNLVNLNLAFNLLSGIKAEEIGRLSRLDQLSISHNVFTGAIPSKLTKLAHLGLLDLSHNRFSGEIPAGIGNMVQLTSLFLNNNLLSGAIPPTLGNCINIYKLDLSHNRLTGNIPPVVASMRDIRIFINLSDNHLAGPLPIELSKLQNVLEMDLSSNKFTGSIFPQISSCIALMKINFSNNSLEGSLPESIGKLRYLESFDVSRNHLSGTIPKSLNNIQSLTFLNLSNNNFKGMIPTGGIFDTVTNMSFLENRQLCRNMSSKLVGIPTCSRNKLFHSNVFLITFVLVIFISVLLSTICCVIGIRRIRAIIHTRTTETVRKSIPVELIHNFPRITYKELLDATAGFDDQRLVGSGSYGRVYRGVLPDGTTIAVKVLHVQSGNSTKSFSRECQVLKRIRHRNLIRIITACSLPDFKALVLPYMANGSLDSRLYPHSDTGLVSSSSDLSLLQRVNICSDIAEGMAYLHHHSPVRVIHCDLKPSNILLNDELTALVSDFGIAKLVMTAGGGNSGAVETGNSTVNMLHGSVGYIAPEYGFGSATSTKGDVYSFGIIVLEMVTRRRPIDDIFVGGLSLHKWVKSHFHERVERVIDTSLVRATRDQTSEVKNMWEIAIGELIELGILCTQDSPSTRPTMLDAADDLDRLKRYLGGDTTVTFTSSLGISSSTVSDD